MNNDVHFLRGTQKRKRERKRARSTDEDEKQGKSSALVPVRAAEDVVKRKRSQSAGPR